MEKISLFDLLSFLLPGAVATFLIEFYMTQAGYLGFLKDLEQHYALALFLSASLFLGSFIHYLGMSKTGLELFRAVGLYDKISDIYENSDEISKHIRKFFNQKLIIFQKLGYETQFERFEQLWKEIYYYLEVNKKNEMPKTYQSFYFFFRNCFSVGLVYILALVVGGILLKKIKYEPHQFLLAVVVIVISIFAGQMHRKQMVQKMFLHFYTIHSSPQTSETDDNEES